MLNHGGAETTVVLTKHRERALKLRKERTRAVGGGLERARVAVPADVISDAWALAGDGRHLVTRAQREALASKLLESQHLIARTPGAARMLASFACRYAGTLTSSSRDAVDLGESEAAVLSLFDAYGSALESAGLIELGEAARLLASFDNGSRYIFDEPLDLPVQVERYFRARLADGAPALHEGVVQLAPLEGAEVGFSFPAGFEAVLSALRSEIVEGCEGGTRHAGFASCAVLTPRAQDLFDMVAPELASSGVSVRVQTSMAFRRTDFARALLSARDVVEGAGAWRTSAVDFAYSAFSGMPARSARSLDQALRADRLMSCSEAAQKLKSASPSFGWFSALASSYDVEAFEHIGRFLTDGSRVPSRDVDRERSAMGAYVKAAEAVSSVDASYRCVFELLESAAVSLDRMVGAAEGSSCQVLIAPPSASDAFVEGEFDKVVVGDVSDGAYHVSPGTDALDSLACKLGVERSFDPSEAVKRGFSRAVCAARDDVVCVFPQRDANGDESYPAFFVDEFIASLPGYEEATSFDKDLLGLPVDVASRASRIGEDDIACCLASAVAAPVDVASFPTAQRGSLSAGDVLCGMRTVEEDGEAVAVLSPSAIEAYLSCPYRWFVERRLRLGALDEEFGPAEKGTFVHAAFAALFDALADRGVHQITRRGLPAAHELLDEILDDLVARQAGSTRSRLAACTRAEQLEIERLRDQIHSTVDRLSLLPADFDVLCHERSLAVEDGIDYAGIRLTGRVDRVDVNEESRRFVVLDYKGTSAGYAAGIGEDEDLSDVGIPAKIQALVYAQALRSQLPGYSCAAALYLGYRARSTADFAAGSFDASAYDASAVARKASQVEMNFDRYLDRIEEALRPLLAQLSAGSIPCEPRSKNSCSWCPYERCERRSR